MKVAVFIFLFLISLSGLGQILNDTFSTGYGPVTTFIFNEEQLQQGLKRWENPDTTINEIDQYSHLWHKGNWHQDLGNFGSAMHPVFYRPQRNIGVQYGINIYDNYFISPEDVRYFNTRSPFTELEYLQGANNFAHLTVEFSRNINPQWNGGFKLDRFTSDKAIAAVGRDRLVEHWGFVGQSNFESRNGRYFALYHFSNMSHQVEEQGGIRPFLGDRIPEDLYLYQDADVWLNDAFTFERRNNHHLYHHFRILPDSVADLRIFHEFDRINIKSRYTDQETAIDTFYQNNFIDPSQTFLQLQYSLYENKAGLTGGWGDGGYFKAYVRHRRYYTNLRNAWEDELYLGGEVVQDIRVFEDSMVIKFSGESALPGDYRGGVQIIGSSLNAEFFRSSVSPTVVQESFYSNHFIWNKSLQRTTSDNLNLSYRLRFKKQSITPFVKLNRVAQMIYFDENAAPSQANESIEMVHLGIEHHFQFWKIHFKGMGQWTRSNGPDIYRAPEFFAREMLYFETLLTQGKAAFQFGFEAFYRSRYYGNAYMPGIFQYHLQNEFFMDEAIVPDFFVNFQFRKAQAFIKVPYFTQGWADPGYFSTPYYTGIPRPDFVALGFRWQFYD